MERLSKATFNFHIRADSATGRQTGFNARMLKILTFVALLPLTSQLKALRRQTRFTGISSLYALQQPYNENHSTHHFSLLFPL